MTNVNQTLQKLSTSFSVRDIMISVDNLLVANNYNEAIKLFSSYDYNIIPIKNKNGYIIGFIERDNNKVNNLSLDFIVSDATSILELINHFENKKFVFILCGNKIGGYIHFSDLNSEVVKLPFYLLLESTESSIISLLDNKINDETLFKALGKERFDFIKIKMEKLIKKDANLNWFSLLYFSEIVKISTSLNLIKIMGNEIDTISNVRNLISHTGTPLVSKHSDVKKLVDAQKICYSILKQVA